ncbi:putative syntaxin 6, N-terminal [Lyophyllum shimeji]|uniref:Syntaxin 6, N-terminal n=1 Tax=Lyophyllum shimeji TaxID=47721 RepID=A0A9P3PSU7_LYOSH|nr:putative syntaxin 6, N-terminal [Lyophyllum shimeji]
MSTDPYHAVEHEVQTTLQTAAQLRSSYLRIRSTAREDSEELRWAANELKATLATLEADLEDLDESVKMVESTDARLFGLDDAEVQRRRRYVGDVRKEIQSMRAELAGSSSQIARPGVASRSGVASPRGERERGDGEDHQEAWAREEQQLIMQEQDRTMDTIAGTLHTLAQQAGLMGQEIVEHNELLDDLERGVDQTDSKLNNAMLRMRKFMRQSEEKGSGWCIIILIIILMILLLAVILL